MLRLSCATTLIVSLSMLGPPGAHLDGGLHHSGLPPLHTHQLCPEQGNIILQFAAAQALSTHGSTGRRIPAPSRTARWQRQDASNRKVSEMNEPVGCVVSMPLFHRCLAPEGRGGGCCCCLAASEAIANHIPSTLLEALEEPPPCNNDRPSFSGMPRTTGRSVCLSQSSSCAR